MKIKQIGWWADIDGKSYSNFFDFGTNNQNLTNSQIKVMSEMFSKNMSESLQRVITGKTDTEIKAEKIKDDLKCQTK